MGPVQFSTHYFDLGQGGIVRSLASDAAGNLFVVSTVLSGTTQTTVVTKTDGAGKVIATFRFGGSGQDYPSVAAIDPNGDLVIGGATTSTDFPLVSPLQTSGSGFLTKLDPDLQKMRYSTRVGTLLVNGVLNGVAAIAFDGASNIYVAGTAGPDMPVTAGAFQAHAPGTASSQTIISYGFVAEIAAGGDRLLFSTYYTGGVTGGTPSGRLGSVFLSTSPTAMALDSSGAVVIAGTTDTSDLPVTAGAYAQQCGCGFQQNAGFVAKIGSGGTHLLWGTYLPLIDASGYNGAEAPEWRGHFGDGAGRLRQHRRCGQYAQRISDYTGCPPVLLSTHEWRVAFSAAGRLRRQARRVGQQTHLRDVLRRQCNGPPLGQMGVGGMAIDGDGTIWLTGGSAPVALPCAGCAGPGSKLCGGALADGAHIAALYTAPDGAASTAIAATAKGSIAALGYPNSLLIGRPAQGPSVMGIAGSVAFRVSGFVAPREAGQHLWVGDWLLHPPAGPDRGRGDCEFAGAECRRSVRWHAGGAPVCGAFAGQRDCADGRGGSGAKHRSDRDSIGNGVRADSGSAAGSAGHF